MFSQNVREYSFNEQEGIPVGRVPVGYPSYMLQWPATRGPQVNRFEQVSGLGHQMSPAGGQDRVVTVQSEVGPELTGSLYGEVHG